MANTGTLPTTAVVANSKRVFSVPMISAARMVTGTCPVSPGSLR